MIITFVMDQYGNLSNGTTCTAMRFARSLVQRGHEVRVLTCYPYDGAYGEKVYVVSSYHIPVFNHIVESQGMRFARPEDKVILEAIDGADVVHFMLPFPLQKRTLTLCKERNILCTGAFHCQPENITYTIKLGHFKSVNRLVYRKFRKFYNQLAHVHCPSQMIANQLRKHGYTSALHVISNGVVEAFQPIKVERPSIYEGKILITMVGRLSGEKRQDLLIDACAKSKYREQIILSLCGNGPLRKKLERRSKKLANPIQFQFLNQQDLVTHLNQCDIYVHASDAEIEAISCIEAFACGLVPIISDSKISATNQFALDPMCLFKAGNSSSLASAIDHMIEHPEKREALSNQYIAYGKTFAIESCVNQFEQMFRDAVQDHREKKK